MTFFFMCLFVILVFWRPQDWLVPALYGWPMLDVIVVMSLITLVMERDQGSIRFNIKAPQVWLAGGLWLSTLMSHIAHGYLVGLLWTYAETFKFSFFLVVFMWTLDRPGKLRALAWIFVVMACLMSYHALLQESRGYGFAGQRPVLSWRPDVEGPVARSLFFGIFEDPNDLSQILATAIPFGFALFRQSRLLNTLVGCAVLYILFIASQATHSRGGDVALVIVGVTGLALLLPARWTPGVLLTIAFGGLALMPFADTFLDASAHDRVVFWGEANWAFKRNPIFGVGYGMFGEYVSGARAAHNAFVLCYTELGLFGYWFWYNLLHLSFVSAWRTREALRKATTPDARWLRTFSGISIAAMSGFIVSSYFLSRAFVYPLCFLFAMMGSLPVIAERHLPVDHPPLINIRRDVLMLGSIGAFVSITYIYGSILILNKVWGG